MTKSFLTLVELCALLRYCGISAHFITIAQKTEHLLDWPGYLKREKARNQWEQLLLSMSMAILFYSVFLYLTFAAGTFSPDRCPAVNYSLSFHCSGNMLGEPLASNGLPLWLHYSDFQASCH
jgi:hypothetical protein